MATFADWLFPGDDETTQEDVQGLESDIEESGVDSDPNGTTGGSGGLIATISANPKAWIVATLIGSTVAAVDNRLSGGESALEILFEEMLFVNLLRPAGEAVWNSGIAFLDSMLIALFGTDGEIGVGQGAWLPHGDGSAIGLVDIPLAIVSPFVDGILGVGLYVVNGISAYNEWVGGLFAPFGPFAPAVVAGLWAVEVGIVLYGASVLIRAIDIPAIRAVGIVRAILAPFKLLWRAFL